MVDLIDCQVQDDLMADLERFARTADAEAMEPLLRGWAMRTTPPPGRRQVRFDPCEVLMCYLLFWHLNPHSFGGSNIEQAPRVLHRLAALTRRSPNSILQKMFNLDGSRPNGARGEVRFAALLDSDPRRVFDLHDHLIDAAGRVGIPDGALPRLERMRLFEGEETLLQSDIDMAIHEARATIDVLASSAGIEHHTAERLIERKVRVGHHRFARGVLSNCDHTCVFCGFQPTNLTMTGMLRASHIKPWANSTPRERGDIRNGLAACPTHDQAFDAGLLKVNGGLRVHRSPAVEESLRSDRGSDIYFGENLTSTLILSTGAARPRASYLAWHADHVFRG